MAEDTPAVRMHRRPGDFGRRSVVLFQMGTTTSCCCCLHWIGAAAGGVWGFRAALRKETELSKQSDAWFAVRNGFLAALLLSLTVIGSFVSLLAQVQWLTPVLLILALIPSLIFVPAGLVAIGIGLRYKQGQPNEVGNLPFALGCRLAWMSLLYAFAGTLAGYAMMYLLTFFLR